MWFSLILIIHCILITTGQYKSLFDYECETNLNCTNHLANSICFNKKCICQFGYKLGGCIVEKNELRYRRQINYENIGTRMLGEECDWSSQCRQMSIDNTKVCFAHKCQCSQGYVPIDAHRCVRDFVLLPLNIRVTKSYQEPSSGYGSTCSKNIDCHQTSFHLECIQGICVCLEGYVLLGKNVCYNTRGQGDSTEISTPFSTTSTNHPVNNEVIKSLGKIGNTCINDYFCRQAVSQSHCYNGKCACVDGYIPIDQYSCIKDMYRDTTIKSTPIPVNYKSLLGGKCLTKRNCHTPNAVCLFSICACPKGYFPVDDWTCLEEPESSDEELIEATSVISTTTMITTTKMTTFSTTSTFRWWPWSPTTTTFSTTSTFRWWPWSPTPTTFSTTSTFRWWPWSPAPTIRTAYPNMENTFSVRCLLNRQCVSMDKNSHCTFLGRCICNRGYILKKANRGQYCIPRIINEEDCD
ncbi:unnamed protein product [Rotaria sordida]|uniref:EGF-like domain-containing protein n=1 Tax=Rotaria sordida TaxID=392033 RepID=A0A813XJ79_9BILA|nr:unnamed protein product [Rotaria sordida]